MSYSAPGRGLWASSWHSTLAGMGDGWLPLNLPAHTVSAWPVANRATFIPFPVRQRIIVRKLWVGSGATGTGNIDLGIYDAGGTRLVSTGSTAKQASTGEQVIDVTDTTIGPGQYWLAVVSSNGTDTFYHTSVVAPIPAAMGLLVQTSALPLPATATFAVPQAMSAIVTAGVLFVTTVS